MYISFCSPLVEKKDIYLSAQEMLSNSIVFQVISSVLQQLGACFSSSLLFLLPAVLSSGQRGCFGSCEGHAV